DGADALGHAAPTQDGRAAGHQYPKHVVAALARLAEAGEPLPGAGEQLRRIRTRDKPGDQEEGRRLVRARRSPAAVLLRRHLDRVQGRPRHEVETDSGPTLGLRLSHDLAERDRRTDPSESDAGDPDDGGRTRRLAARSLGRGEGAAAAATR